MKKIRTISTLVAVGLLCAVSVSFAAQQETLVRTDKKMHSTQFPSAESGQDALDLVSLSQELPEWKARWELARVLSYVQRYDEAIDEYQKVLEEKPSLQQARLEMAKVMAWAGKTDQAQDILESFSSEDLDPESRLDLADIYAAQKKYEQAVSIYDSYLRDNPDQDRVRLKLAQTLSWASKYESSLKHYEMLVNKRPDDIQLRRQYAQALTWAEQYEQAIEQYRKTLKD